MLLLFICILMYGEFEIGHQGVQVKETSSNVFLPVALDKASNLKSTNQRAVFSYVHVQLLLNQYGGISTCAVLGFHSHGLEINKGQRVHFDTSRQCCYFK